MSEQIVDVMVSAVEDMTSQAAGGDREHKLVIGCHVCDTSRFSFLRVLEKVYVHNVQYLHTQSIFDVSVW